MFAIGYERKRIIKMERKNITSGTKWEDIVGYSRGVRMAFGEVVVVEIAGTTAVDDNGEVVGKNDLYAQTKFIFQKIEKALHEAGLTMADVVRTRMFLTDIGQWQEMGRAHGEFFRDVKPASTAVEVSALIQPDMLIEIEVTAMARPSGLA
jgi:enamine deaminase RidA (YjgF/YER057c/UK114 family)